MALVSGISTISRLGGRLLKGDPVDSFSNVHGLVFMLAFGFFGAIAAAISTHMAFYEGGSGWLSLLWPTYVSHLAGAILGQDSLIVRFAAACVVFFFRALITLIMLSFGLFLSVIAPVSLLFGEGRGGDLFALRTGAVLVALVSLPLVYPVGLFGRFCGRFIQAAVCRQREFLADASALEFTRNPDGLISLLNKIKSSPEAGALGSGVSIELGHMIFVDGVPAGFSPRIQRP